MEYFDRALPSDPVLAEHPDRTLPSGPVPAEQPDHILPSGLVPAEQLDQKRVMLLLERLSQHHALTRDEYRQVIEGFSPEAAAYAAQLAVPLRQQLYSTDVFVRGLLEISSYCRNDCLYCGIRRSNKDAVRCRLDKEKILECARQGYDLGMRTFVLQGGEDPFFTDDKICDIVYAIRSRFPDCAITLYVGEKSLLPEASDTFGNLIARNFNLIPHSKA